ncbi:unnamed protein product [Rotaria sp. Silwood2]|nr:unnamed protein product [Rotaria sp. Silwood2]
MEDRFQFEDFDNPQLLATNNRDQEITIVAANDKIKRTKNEQQVIKENNLREPNQQKSIEPTHLDIISSENYLLTITLGPVNMLDAESYKITCCLDTWAVGGTLIMFKREHEVVHAGTDSTSRFAFIKTTYSNNRIVIVIVNVYAPAQITERSRATNPNTDYLIQLEIIRKDIRSLLEEKININLPCHQEHNIQSLGILAKAHFTYSKCNQNRIQFLERPTKGRVETDLEILEIATDFCNDLYDVKTADTTI